MNTLSYARVPSGQISDAGMSIENQKASIKEWSFKAGATIIGEFEDIGSANATCRQGLAALKEFINRNPRKVQAIVAVSGDRLYRSYPAFCNFIQWLREAGIRIITVEDLSMPEMYIAPDTLATEIPGFSKTGGQNE